MKPYTKTAMDPEDLRKNWRGNRCSKGRIGDKDGKGKFKEKIGNNNYHRKSKDRPEKKKHRQEFKHAWKKDYFIDEEISMICSQCSPYDIELYIVEDSEGSTGFQYFSEEEPSKEDPIKVIGKMFISIESGNKEEIKKILLGMHR